MLRILANFRDVVDYVDRLTDLQDVFGKVEQLNVSKRKRDISMIRFFNRSP